MPKTPESGGIPLPPSWPPFTRDKWDERARCLIASLSRMGHEEEDYAAVPAAVNLSKEALERAEGGREESSIGMGKRRRREEMESKKKSGGEGVKMEEGGVKQEDDENDEDNEEEDTNRLKVKPTKPLKTYDQRRKFIVKAMDLHRHTIGGGRSGRRGRAECVAFFRRVLEIFDEEHEEALETEGGGGGVENEEGERDDKGGYVAREEEEEEEEESSSSEEEEEESEEEEEEEEEEESEEEEAEPKLAPKQSPRASAAAASSTTSSPRRKGPGRPRKSETSTPANSTSAPSSTPAPPITTRKSSKSKVPKIIIKNEQDFFDQHNDLCEVCNQPGELLCCATCNLVFHTRCARPKLHAEPPDDWKCAYCWAAGVMGGKKDGKERRKAGQACREMERMRKVLREERERRKRDGVEEEEEEEEVEEEEEEVEVEEEEEEDNEEDDDEEDEEEEDEEVEEEEVEEEEESEEEEEEEEEVEEKKPAAKKPPRARGKKRGPKAPRATLEEAAATGCKKCQRELETGEKTRKVHADFCPRKWKTVGAGRPQGAAAAARLKQEEEEEMEIIEVDEEEEEEEEEEDPTPTPSIASSRESPKDGRMVSLEEAAAAGCIKCQKELATGEKTRKVHADYCPRKYRGTQKGTAAAGPSPPPPMEVSGKKAAEEEEEDDEDVKIADLKSPPEQMVSHATAAGTATAAPIRKGPGRPKKSPGRPPSSTSTSKAQTPKQPTQRPISPKNPVTLAEAAAAGCIKCQKELATGLKTRKTHDDHCPRKWRAAGRPPAGTPSPASADAAKLRMVDKRLVQEVKVGSSPGRPKKATVAAAAEEGMGVVQEGVGVAMRKSPGRSPGRPRRGKRTRDHMLSGGNDPSSTAGAAATEEDEAAIAAIGDLAEATAKEQEDRESDEQQQQEEEQDREFVNMFAPGEDDEEGKQEEEAENMKGGGDDGEVSAAVVGSGGGRVTFKLEAEKFPVEMPSFSVAPGLTADEVKSGDANDEDEKMAATDATDDNEEIAEQLRGGGRTKKSPVKMESGEAAAAAKPSPHKTPSTPLHSSGASTPTNLRELEGLEVPTPLKLGDEHELTYSNVGRVQRSRKRPAIFEPDTGPDSKWGSDGDVSPLKRHKLADGSSAAVSSSAKNSPEPLRGGARPKKEEVATSAEAPSSDAAAATTPRPRGRPPTKQTKRSGAKKKNAKRAPIKKETNNTVAGVGILNRKPGSLFDCSVCLDISKIKICCYCACRLCFNKFGKEQTILCDKCDQEYHTFCLGLDRIPDEEWECPACIEDEKKKKIAEQRKKEREAKKKQEEEKRKEEEARKVAATAKRRAAYQERKKQEEERKRLQSEKRKQAYERRKQKEAELKAQGIAVGGGKDKSPIAQAATIITRKRGPGRPPKAETLARMQAQLLLQQQHQQAAASSSGQPVKRGRGRPRKDGSAPIPRKLPAKSEISTANLYIDMADVNVERSRSGRKIQRTVFHDEMEGGGLMKRMRSDSEYASASGSASARGAQASMYVAERSAAAAAKNAIAGRSAAAGSRKEPRRKPGARECMQMSRKFGCGVIEQKYFDVLMDYSKRGKVDHLIRMRERMDEHSRYLESQLAGLEALVKEKGEWNGKVPPAKAKSEH